MRHRTAIAHTIQIGNAYYLVWQVHRVFIEAGDILEDLRL